MVGKESEIVGKEAEGSKKKPVPLLTSEEMRKSSHHYTKAEIESREPLDSVVSEYGPESVAMLTAPKEFNDDEKELWHYFIKKCAMEGHAIRQTSLPALKRLCVLQHTFDRAAKEFAMEGETPAMMVETDGGDEKKEDPMIKTMISLNKSIQSLEDSLGMTMKSKRPSEKKEEGGLF